MLLSLTSRSGLNLDTASKVEAEAFQFGAPTQEVSVFSPDAAARTAAAVASADQLRRTVRALYSGVDPKVVEQDNRRVEAAEAQARARPGACDAAALV